MDGTDDSAGPPDGTASDEPSSPPRHSRRWFVAGGVALLAGAGAGVTAGLAGGTSRSATPDPVPQPLRTQLQAAVADERVLVALARDAQRDGDADPTVAAALLRDHEAHLAALTAALRELTPVSTRTVPPVTATVAVTVTATVAVTATATGTATATATSRTGQPVRDRAGLRNAEQQAARLAARRAARLAGHRQTATVAVLLASIAACEATHAELLHD